MPTFAEKAELALSGIGEKKISSPPLYETFEETLYREFPNLREGGGFEVLRGSGKLLQSIPIPSGGYSVDYLKSVLAQAKCYVRPLRMDLILNREEVYMCLFVLINCLELLYVISTASSQKAHFTENVLKRGESP